ncbi:hypothetical protein VSR82_32885 [Burkholderia sp. JPY481]
MEKRIEEMSGGPLADSEACTSALVGVLLADAVTDIEVVRELGISEEMVERLQRAVERCGARRRFSTQWEGAGLKTAEESGSTSRRGGENAGRKRSGTPAQSIGQLFRHKAEGIMGLDRHL